MGWLSVTQDESRLPCSLGVTHSLFWMLSRNPLVPCTAFEPRSMPQPPHPPPPPPTQPPNPPTPQPPTPQPPNAPTPQHPNTHPQPNFDTCLGRRSRRNTTLGAQRSTVAPAATVDAWMHGWMDGWMDGSMDGGFLCMVC